MGTTRRPKTPKPPPPSEDELLLPQAESPGDAALMAKVEQLRGSGGVGGVITVYSQGMGGYHDLTFLAEYSPAEFSIRQVQLDYGPGLYRAHIQSETGEFIANQGFKIGAMKTGDIPQSQKKPPEQAQGGPDMGALVATMMGGFREIANAMKQSQTPPMSVKETIELLATLNNNRPATPDPMAMIAQLLSIQKMLTGDRPPVNADGETDSGAIIVKALDTFGKPLADLLSQASAQKAAQAHNPQAAALALTPPEVLANPALPPAATPLEDDAQMMQVKMFLPLLVAMAAKNAEPATYADLILDTFDDATLAKYIEVPNWFDQLAALDPAIIPHRAWFEKVHAEIIAVLTAPAEGEETSSDPAPGNPDNVVSGKPA